MPLIEDARQKLHKQVRDAYRQEIADQICQDMRIKCETLLREQGIRTNIFEGDSKSRPFMKSLARFMLSTLQAPSAWKHGLSIKDHFDHLKLVRTIHVDDKEPVRTTVVSDFAVPEKSPDILLKIEGLEEALSLRKGYGQIYKRETEVIGKNNLFIPSRKIIRWVPDRRANLDEADAWREEIVDRLTGLR